MSRELDEQVAREVMGWTRKRKTVYSSTFEYVVDEDTYDYWTDGKDIEWRHWSPSTDPAAMMQVVEKMVAEKWKFTIVNSDDTKKWAVHIEDKYGAVFRADADKLPEAVALAALDAVRAKGGA